MPRSVAPNPRTLAYATGIAYMVSASCPAVLAADGGRDPRPAAQDESAAGPAVQPPASPPASKPWAALAERAAHPNPAAPAEKRGEDPAGHVGYEILGAAIGLGVAALPAALLAGVTMPDSCDAAPCMRPLRYGALGGSLAALALVPAGASIAGDLTGGEGSYWGSLLGSATVLAPTALGLTLARPHYRIFFPVLGSLAVSLAGAVVGYRFSAPDRPRVVLGFEPAARIAMLSVSARL